MSYHHSPDFWQVEPSPHPFHHGSGYGGPRDGSFHPLGVGNNTYQYIFAIQSTKVNMDILPGIGCKLLRVYRYSGGVPLVFLAFIAISNLLQVAIQPGPPEIRPGQGLHLHNSGMVCEYHRNVVLDWELQSFHAIGLQIAVQLGLVWPFISGESSHNPRTGSFWMLHSRSPVVTGLVSRSVSNLNAQLLYSSALWHPCQLSFQSKGRQSR